eukprot:gnl/MRDRNA2_/MRDRNA2_22661_c0_seq1.p1 gnl/MRDRNA2_/MRDRNA2_22661_c0~~gnl/MRDRNA2_/MRDRNA2_22661_c0_seq1.p1  ORF type:complete len:262 (-),score=39.11 gnl/MRDRNA2_/MRDRNA2_22661_c0_seq1:307-1092(-)
MWTRVEQFAHMATHGIDTIHIADEEHLLPISEEWARDVICVFDGQATCCRKKHDGMQNCDKEMLVKPFIALWHVIASTTINQKSIRRPDSHSRNLNIASLSRSLTSMQNNFKRSTTSLSSATVESRASEQTNRVSLCAELCLGTMNQWLFDNINEIKDKVFPRTFVFVTETSREERTLFADLIYRVEHYIREGPTSNAIVPSRAETKISLQLPIMSSPSFTQSSSKFDSSSRTHRSKATGDLTHRSVVTGNASESQELTSI